MRPVPLNAIASLALIAGLASPAHALIAPAPPADTTITKEMLAEGIYLFRAPSDLDKWTATNVVVIVNDDDVTVFDSNSRLSTARAIIAEIKKITPKPVRTLINSHWHLDHWSGNDAYVKAFPGVQIIATTETRDFMKRMPGKFYAFGLNNSVTRGRASLDSAVRSGKKSDGTRLTAEDRRKQETDIAETADFAAEVASTPRILPTLAYRDSLVLWSGKREFRLISVTGDATGSTVLYLPAEKMLVMGDVLVDQEAGGGPRPWTTNSYAITPWLNSLRALEKLDATVVVPGQGPAFRDKAYLTLDADLLESILDQVHAATERGLTTLSEVQAAVNLDAIARRYTGRVAADDARFKAVTGGLIRKALQETYDGVARQ
jgi:glyoxylase-like metal-dependent hydrolase (beta-lactamase superfamily II)